MRARLVFMRNTKTRRKRYDACDELCELNTMDQFASLEHKTSGCDFERRSDVSG